MLSGCGGWSGGGGGLGGLGGGGGLLVNLFLSVCKKKMLSTISFCKQNLEIINNISFSILLLLLLLLLLSALFLFLFFEYAKISNEKKSVNFKINEKDYLYKKDFNELFRRNKI